MEQHINNYEHIKEQVLKELKETYILIPKESQPKLDLSPLWKKYLDLILQKCYKQEIYHNGFSQKDGIKNAITRVVCLHFGCYKIKDLSGKQYEEFYSEIERFINEYIGVRDVDGIKSFTDNYMSKIDGGE